MDDEIDRGKRRFLCLTTGLAGAIGAGFAAVPFVSSFQPSARVQAASAPVEVDISELEAGQLLRVNWRGKPVWILRRDQATLQALSQNSDDLRDPLSQDSDQPDASANPVRSIRPEIFVAIGICTHLGCSPTYRPEPGGLLGDDWEGGFFCPCHGSTFDLAGRVYKDVPAPNNLVIPPYRFLSDNTLLIGEDEPGSMV